MLRLLPERALLFLASAAVAGATAASGPLLLDAAVVADAIVAVGERGLILRSPRNELNWRPVNPSEVVPTLCGVAFADETHGWAAGHGGLILGTTDGGATWESVYQDHDPETSFLDVCALSARHIIAIGAFGTYLESRDGGREWERRLIIEEDFHLNRISRRSDGTLFIAGESGTLLRSADAGATWQPLETDNGGSFFGVLPLHEGGLLAYGLRGRVYWSGDDGESWEERTTPTEAVLLAGTQLPNGTIILAGQARVLLASHDGGRTFVSAAYEVPAIAELLPWRDRHLLSFGESGVVMLDVP